jgi:hypothetical protein
MCLPVRSSTEAFSLYWQSVMPKRRLTRHACLIVQHVIIACSPVKLQRRGNPGLAMRQPTGFAWQCG